VLKYTILSLKVQDINELYIENILVQKSRIAYANIRKYDNLLIPKSAQFVSTPNWEIGTEVKALYKMKVYKSYPADNSKVSAGVVIGMSQYFPYYFATVYVGEQPFNKVEKHLAQKIISLSFEKNIVISEFVSNSITAKGPDMVGLMAGVFLWEE